VEPIEEDIDMELEDDELEAFQNDDNGEIAREAKQSKELRAQRQELRSKLAELEKQSEGRKRALASGTMPSAALQRFHLHYAEHCRMNWQLPRACRQLPSSGTSKSSQPLSALPT